MAAVKRCHRCRAPLGKQYIRAEDWLFHVACFRCAQCQQPLGEEFRIKNGQICHPRCDSGRHLCTHCRQPLEAQWITLDGKKLHQACYQAHYQENCALCGGELTGTLTRDAEGSYHPNCYAEQRAPRCDACQQPITAQFLEDPWGQRMHPHHGGLPTLQCHVCARLISERTTQGGVRHGDGRVVCGLCRITEVTTSEQIESARAHVLAHLSALGFSSIPTWLAVNLADQRTLQRRLGVGRQANTHGYTKTVIRTLPDQGRVQEHSIFILYGLPRLPFMGVLAHELLHVWLNERQLGALWSEKEIEGFCNLATAAIYRHDDTPLARVLLQRLEQDRDPIYGEGYRQMAARLARLGWPGLLAQVQQPPRGLLGRLKRLGDRLIQE